MGYRCRHCSQCPAQSVAYSRYVMPATLRVCICINMPDARGSDQPLLYDLITHDRHHCQV